MSAAASPALGERHSPVGAALRQRGPSAAPAPANPGERPGRRRPHPRRAAKRGRRGRLASRPGTRRAGGPRLPRPGDGAIISLVGGIGFALIQVQSRHPGPAPARLEPEAVPVRRRLDAGFTAASIINDAPIVVDDSSLEGVWRPENDSGKFLRADAPALGPDQARATWCRSASCRSSACAALSTTRRAWASTPRTLPPTCPSPWAPTPCHPWSVSRGLRDSRQRRLPRRALPDRAHRRIWR
jgi:hypothetical protein